MKEQEQISSILEKHKLFTNQLSNLLNSLLEVNKIKFHIIESRTKELRSLNEKLDRKKIGSMNDITDLSGIRIILYYQDDVDKIEKLLRDNFDIDEKNSINKADLYKTNEFGYLSIHFIISISKNRFNLPEWNNYKGLKAEVQIRTVLQHSWASISHELSYKKEYDIPTSLERKLFRLAGLFELADEEFLSIRNEHSNLLHKIEKADSNNEFEKEEINFITLNYLFTQSKYKILNEITNNALTAGFTKPEFDDNPLSFISSMIEITQVLKIKTIQELLEIIEKNKKTYPKYFDLIFSKSGTKEWSGDTPFYVGLALMYEYNKEQIELYVENNQSWDRSMLERVVSTIKMLKKY